MKKFVLAAGIALLALSGVAQQQQDRDGVITNPEEITVTFLGETQPWRDIPVPKDPLPITKPPKYGYHFKADWYLNPNINPNALPKGGDKATQKEYNTNPATAKSTEIANWEGIQTNTMPGDPAMDVGPNHVVQMMNGFSGARVQIWNKSGATLLPLQNFSTLAGTTPGGGDPIVLYDERADRWLLSEFASGGGSQMYVAISTTPDPTGSYYTFVVNANSFPDYPKYSIWDDSYIITANEGTTTSSVYALDRNAMLAGGAANAQRFTIPRFGTIGFQAGTPVSLMGTVPSGTPAILMRMRDDAWSGAASDALEIWELDINWASPGSATLSQVQTLDYTATDPNWPFETELCGYTSFSCIQQSGSGTQLDPLREILMNRAMYRNFGTHESIVTAHAVDVDGSDRAGIRWYELRRSGGSWDVYQYGTYSSSTDAHSRWMPTIGISASGNIGMAYNVSSSSIHPEIRYTGRKECDALGMMTEPEVQLVDGTSPNNSNRWGDYNAMGVDPVDGETFWFTAQYNPATQARTRIGAFRIDQCSPTVQFQTSAISANEDDDDTPAGCLPYHTVNVNIKIGSDPSMPADIIVNVAGGTATQGVDYDIFNNAATLDDPNLDHDVEIRIYNDDYVEGNETIDLDYTLNPNGGNATTGTVNQAVTITINDDDLDPTSSLTSTVVLTEDFEGLGGALPAGWTTNNPSGDTPWQTGDNAAATSTYYTIPTSNTTDFVWINDDDCNCDQSDVDLTFPSIDLTGYTSATINFDSYYEHNSFSGDQENAELRVSVGGGPATVIGTLQASVIDVDWINQSFDLTPYVGNSNVVLSVNYSDDTGWLYGCSIDNITITGSGPIDIQQSVNTSAGMTANLGPNETVHFYDPANGDVMMTLENTSSHDFGCTTVEVDRAGTSAQEFSSSSTSKYLADKTFTVVPTNNSSSATYNVTLYYKETEVAGWEATTGEVRTNAEVIKVAGNNRIDDVTPANFGSYNIENPVATIGTFNTDVTFTASFGSGFSGFGIGVYEGIPGAPDADFTASSSTECEGGCINFTDASVSTDPGGITAWAWDFGDGNTSTMQNPSNCFTTAGTYVVSLTVTDAVASDTYTSVVTIGAATSSSQNADLCPGQTITVGTSTYDDTDAGTQTDVLVNAAGCDSTVTTMITALTESSFSQSFEFCDGGSVTVGTSTYTTSGVYTDIFANSVGCDSTVTTTVTVNANPTPSIETTSLPDSLCINDDPITLTATPVGGSFTGSGVAGNTFVPSGVAVGTHTITYSYTDGNGCSGNDQVSIVVYDCTVGVTEEDLTGVSLFPSPNNGQFVISGLETGTAYQIFDETGKLVASETVDSDNHEVTLNSVANGIYVLKTTKDGKEGSIKFTVTKK